MVVLSPIYIVTLYTTAHLQGMEGHQLRRNNSNGHCYISGDLTGPLLWVGPCPWVSYEFPVINIFIIGTCLCG